MKVAILLASVLLVPCFALPQVGLESVPSEHRKLLESNLALLVGYERSRQWDKEFELVTQRNSVMTKRTFAERMSHYSNRLRDFSLTEAQRSAVDADQWFLYGNITVKTAKGTKCFEGRFVANLDNGQWRFSPILESLIIPVDGTPTECR
jgi:hypothetical protein